MTLVETSGKQTQEDWARLAVNLRVEASLLRVLDLLADLPVVVFKGPTLTRLVYGDLFRRVSGDNDLWVPPSHSMLALERLLARGYRPLPGLDARRALQRVGQVALGMESGEDRVWVDLHEYPFARRLFQVEEEVLLAHLMEVDLHGRTIRTFDRPLAFLHMVAHYIQHRFEAEKLPVLAEAWDTWDLDLPELRWLAERTVTVPALEFALAAIRPLSRREIPSIAHFRSKTILRLLDPARLPEKHPLLLKGLQLTLLSPENMARTALSAVFLEPDELRYRYGEGPPWRLAVAHLKFLLRRSP